MFTILVCVHHVDLQVHVHVHVDLQINLHVHVDLQIHVRSFCAECMNQAVHVIHCLYINPPTHTSLHHSLTCIVYCTKAPYIDA